MQFPHLLSTLLTILSPTKASLTNPDPLTKNTTLLTFDDLPTKNGLNPLPQPYAHLTFSPSFSVLNPHSPALSKLITPEDVNCATSLPNALLGSDHTETSSPPKTTHASFTVNKSSTVILKLNPYFSLEGFEVKPLNAPEPGTMVFVRGTKTQKTATTTGDDDSDNNNNDDNKILEWNVYFPSGYHLPLSVRMEEFSGHKWDMLDTVEVWAEFGEDRLDWEFCIDDLRVRFEKLRKEEEEEGEKSDGKGIEDDEEQNWNDVQIDL